MRPIDRREFLKTSAAAAVALALDPQRLFAQSDPALPRVVVVHGTDLPAMLAAGIERLGGWDAFVQKDRRVTLKVNAGWASTPEQGANTHPVLVEACVRACLDAGAAKVAIPENPCSPAAKSFEMSGIGAAAKRAGARLYEPADKDFQTVEIPNAKILKNVDLVRDILETDCLINMPVAKTHRGATLTASLKNWMGSVRDRGFWHRAGLHQCIADFNGRIRAHLIVVDATRIMTTNGPRGPGKLEYPNRLVFGHDPVAVDAYVATLFAMEPFSVPYIKIAHDMGVGCGDLAKVDIQHLRI